MIIQTNVQQLVSEKFGYKCKTELETTDHDRVLATLSVYKIMLVFTPIFVEIYEPVKVTQCYM